MGRKKDLSEARNGAMFCKRHEINILQKKKKKKNEWKFL